jgi:hypothetical protein
MCVSRPIKSKRPFGDIVFVRDEDERLIKRTMQTVYCGPFTNVPDGIARQWSHTNARFTHRY